MKSASCDRISNDCIFLKGNRGKEPFPTSWQLAFHNDLPNAVVGRYAVFCCSHVELDIFDVYFHFLFKIMGSLTFQITPFLLQKLWNHTILFM